MRAISRVGGPSWSCLMFCVAMRWMQRVLYYKEQSSLEGFASSLWGFSYLSSDCSNTEGDKLEDTVSSAQERRRPVHRVVTRGSQWPAVDLLVSAVIYPCKITSISDPFSVNDPLAANSMAESHLNKDQTTPIARHQRQGVHAREAERLFCQGGCSARNCQIIFILFDKPFLFVKSSFFFWDRRVIWQIIRLILGMW